LHIKCNVFGALIGLHDLLRVVALFLTNVQVAPKISDTVTVTNTVTNAVTNADTYTNTAPHTSATALAAAQQRFRGKLTWTGSREHHGIWGAFRRHGE
jgi:hypothetical protein